MTAAALRDSDASIQLGPSRNESKVMMSNLQVPHFSLKKTVKSQHIADEDWWYEE